MVWFLKTDLEEYWTRIAYRLVSKSKFGEDDQPIETWVSDATRVGLPIHYGLRVAAHLDFKVIDKSIEGSLAKFPSRPTPRNEKQTSFFTTLLDSARSGDSVLAVAPTGTGKTVAGLNTIAELGRAALVIVPSRNLAHQWKKEAMLHLGMSSKRIHVFEGGKCAWEGYHLVIAVIHNLCNREWPPAFYEHFGTVMWDEAHRVGAQVFSQSLQKFPARYRIALTATPDRKDGRTSILHNSFGEPDRTVKGTDMVAKACTVYVVNTRCQVKAKSWGSVAMQMGSLISSVANDNGRNELILDIINAGRKAQRNILILSDRIDQLKWLRKNMSDRYGADPKTMGLFIGSATKDQLERIKRECQIIFATYGMMKEGQDVPRLDMGIDATPRSEGVQAIGRIRRECAGKRHPIWVTLFDPNGSSLLQGISGARIKDYKSCGAIVENVGHTITPIPF